MTAFALTQPQELTRASTGKPLVFFIHATDPDGRDIMPGPFATCCRTQDQALDEAKAAFAGTDYQPRTILFNVAMSPDELAPGELIPWNGGEALRLFGIEQEGRP